MDNFPDGVDLQAIDTLSYDDTVPYEEQIPPENLGGASLADRIGNTKVYLLSESTLTRVGKRKHADDDEETEFLEEDVIDMDESVDQRNNALLLHGSPIANLPTDRIFAYATQFDTHPMGLEWVDDNTCVLVFASKSTARLAFRRLQKSPTEEEDLDGCITAKPIPVTLWPPEERINLSLGKGEGLKGSIRLRWARVEDVKKKGAKGESGFYKKHGLQAGKEAHRLGVTGMDEGPRKRSKRDNQSEDQQRLQLDDEIDSFLAEDDPVEPSSPLSPPSKMRSDYIAGGNKTLLERTSAIRAHPVDEARIVAPLPRRSRRQRDNATDDKWGHEGFNDDISNINPRRNGERSSRQRPKKSQQELDDELEAFLNDRP